MRLTVRTFPDDDEREGGKLCTITGTADRLVVHHGNALAVRGVVKRLNPDLVAALPTIPPAVFENAHAEGTRRTYMGLTADERAVIDFCTGLGALRMFGRALDEVYFADISAIPA